PYGLRRRDTQPDDERFLAEIVEQLRPGDPTAAGREDHVLQIRHLPGQLRLEGAELCFAVAPDNVRNRRARALLDLGVEIEETPAEPVGDEPTDRRLPRGHETDQEDASHTLPVRHAALCFMLLLCSPPEAVEIILEVAAH